MGYKRQKHILETDTESMFIYSSLLKNEKYWRNNGQYYIAKEYELRAKLLLNGNKEGALSPVKTEGKYCPTKKINFEERFF